MGPVWSPNGSSLYFTYNGTMINSAKITVSDEPDQTPILRVGEISTLFPYDSPYDSFEVYPNGEHFLMIVTGNWDGDESTEIKVTLNFFEELKRLAPKQ